ncbi:MAG: alpha,2-mannosyltransferase [Frankiaceae bacterium]|nr:alpha,2-mannosyltransferase [Frankiaceae bacterium]
MRADRLERLGLAVAWLLAAAALANALLYVASASPLFADLQVYRLGLHHLGSGGSGLYDARAVNHAPFTYPPVAAVLLAPLGALSVPAAGAVMTALSLVALGFVARRCVPPGGPALPLLLALALVSVPVRNVLFFGQVGLLLLVLVAADLLDVTPRRMRGAFVGVAAAVKLTPLVFVPLLWLGGRRREALVATATAVLLSAVAAVALPSASATYWTDVLWQTDRVGDVTGPRNRSLWGLVPHGGAGGMLLLGVAVAAVLVVAYVRAGRALRDGGNVAALAVAGMASVAVSPISWSHHLVWLVPAEAVALAARRFGRLAVLAVLTYRLPVGSAHALAVLQGAAALLVVALLPTKRPVPLDPRDTGRPLVGMAGFEPTTSSSRTRRATKLRHIPWYGGESSGERG